jgi:hypothetical protein
MKGHLGSSKDWWHGQETPRPPAPASAVTQPPTSSCIHPKTCMSVDCDFFHNHVNPIVREQFTCSSLETLGCDCAGCTCGKWTAPTEAPTAPPTLPTPPPSRPTAPPTEMS